MKKIFPFFLIIAVAMFSFVGSANAQSTIAEFIEAADTENSTTLNDVTVTYQNGSNIWLKDETGSLLIYSSTLGTFSNGDVITGLTGKYYSYYSNIQLSGPSYTSVITGGDAVAPTVVGVSDITLDNNSAYVSLTGVVVADASLTTSSAATFYLSTIGNSDEQATINTYFKNIEMELNAGDTITVEGVIYYYNAPLVRPTNITVIGEFVDTDVDTDADTDADSGVETIAIYSTGFEASEGFTATQTYNNQTETSFGPEDGQQWVTIYGTASTTSAISGSQSMQMRVYNNETSPLYIPYVAMDFDLENISSVEFLASSSEVTIVPEVTVSYSTDSGANWTTMSTITLTTSATQYTVTPDATITGSARIRFEATNSTYASTQKLYIDDVEIYGEFETSVATPTFSVESCDITEAISVEILCATEGATIYYTIDGTEPTAESTKYNGAITVAETTTINAIAVVGEETSFVATATYRYLTAITIAELIEAADEGNYSILNDVTVLYSTGWYTWVQDETGALLVYGSVEGAVNGDVITGLKGTYTAYKTYVHELLSPTYTSIITGGEEIAPEAFEIANLTTDDVNKYITISGTVTADATLTSGSYGTFYIQDEAENTMTVYASLKNIDIELYEGDVVTILGAVSYHNSSIQICPISITVDEETNTATDLVTQSTYSVYANNGMVYVECEAGAKVEAYSIDGRRVYSALADANTTAIEANNMNVMIVLVDGKATKVAVK